VGFFLVLATSRNLLAALMAHCAALLMGGDCNGVHRQPDVWKPSVDVPLEASRSHASGGETRSLCGQSSGSLQVCASSELSAR
jgi:hypothetical protein